MEIGSDRLRMVLLEPSLLDRYRVVNFVNQPLEPFTELDSAHLAEGLRAGLTALVGNARDVAVWAGLTNDRVRIHHLTLPYMKPGLLPQAVYWALQREEAFSPQKTIIDFEVEKEVTINKERKLIITGFLLPKDDRDALVHIFNEAGFPLRGLALPLYAMRNFFRSEWLPATEETRVFSHIGPQNSRIGVWSDGQSVLTRAIPVGLEQVAEELTQLLHPAPDHGEALRLILQLGRETEEEPTHDPETVFNAIQPALDRMARQIDRTLEYFQTQHKDRTPVTCVYFTGTIAGSPRCVEYLQSQVTLPLQPIDPFDGKKNGTIDFPAEPFKRQTYATAFGLALSNESYTPNFLHTFKDRQRDQFHQRVNVRIFVFFFILAAVLGGFYAQQRSALTHLRTEKNRAESRLQAERPLLTAADLQNRIASLRHDLKQLEQQIDRQQAIALLATLSELTPETVRLESISASFVPPPAGKSKTAASPWIRLVGAFHGNPAILETELSSYVRTLEASTLFTEIKPNFYNLEEQGNRGRLDFDLELSLAPLNPPLNPLPKP